ncbi:VOC family protein [Rhodococcus fascians]|nr:VOC family protein [Rhodococcus fascians]MBY4237322.1 VOC family protein [Rhodococcus fascians]MBY4253001.1 VOC family protein [Rhodococcus fascians]MBY4268759.1 VOC family protein [Rhodococcus fascians]
MHPSGFDSEFFDVRVSPAGHRFWIDGLGAVLERTGEMGGEFLGEVTGAHGAVRMAVVSVAGQTIELLEYRNVQGEQGSSRPYDPGFAHLAFEVDNIDAVLTRIADFGWTAQGTPQPIAGGAKVGTRVIYAVSPHGKNIDVHVGMLTDHRDGTGDVFAYGFGVED